MGRAGLRLLNEIVRSVFDQNKSVPWSVHFTSQVIAGEKIRIPDGPGREAVERSFMQSGNCYYQAKNGIIFSSGTLWGPGAKFISATRDPNDNYQHREGRPIKIGIHCLIGSNAIILPEVELGNHVIVGAGAVVTKSFPDNVVIVGNPARVIRSLRRIST